MFSNNGKSIRMTSKILNNFFFPMDFENGHLSENWMDKLLQADISSEEKLLLLFAWFKASTEKNESSASFEEAVG